MLNTLFRWLSPKSRADGALKMGGVILIIASMNLTFNLITGFGQEEPKWVSLLRALFVGGPWVFLFFLVSHWQLGLQQKLSYLSRKDGLTGLYNRRAFFEKCERQIARQGGAMMMLDADRFKWINDAHGHHIGDACLQAVAKRLRDSLRATDIPGRIGGEEFAIYLAGASIEQAKIVADRIGQPIPFKDGAGDHNLTMTLSIGITEARQGQSIDAMLKQADDALYCAKSNGRARSEVWTEGMVRQANVA